MSFHCTLFENDTKVKPLNLMARILNGWLNKRILFLRAVIIGRQLLYALDHAYFALILVNGFE